MLILYNQAALTFSCLMSIVDTVGQPVEVIIVDNASSDETARLLDRLQRATIIKNAENLHFLRASNQAAAVARGRALLMLNNDTQLTSGTLSAAYQSLFSADDIGAVGGKLILPDGRLQEAGSIVWSDGSCTGYGRGLDPDAPECQFRRQVNYCSGAFLLVRRALFESLGGFDTRYAPAYYEETDLCLRLREAGYRVVYDPRAEVRHIEFGSSRSSAQAFALMRRNQTRFAERHALSLRRQMAPGSPPLFARDPSRLARILVIDDRVPFASHGSGFPRAAHLLQRLAASGFCITQYPLDVPFPTWAEVRANHSPDIEFMIGLGRTKLPEFLEARAGYYDLILISRPHNMRQFIAEHTAHPGRYRGVGIIYDAEAVFALRDTRRAELLGLPVTTAEIEHRVAAEIELGHHADAVVTVTEAEAALFRRAGVENVHVLGHALVRSPTASTFSERRDVLLVGALAGDDSPNVDGLLWFVREVMPHLDAALDARYRIRVVGAIEAAAIADLHHPRIDFLGRIDDLTDTYGTARVFVAPTRFAAGIPHKVHEAAARGVPIVATQLLADQLGWQDDVELLSATKAEAFAARAARLYSDEALWQRLREAAGDRVGRDCSPADFDARLGSIIASVEHTRLRLVHSLPVRGRSGR